MQLPSGENFALLINSSFVAWPITSSCMSTGGFDPSMRGHAYWESVGSADPPSGGTTGDQSLVSSAGSMLVSKKGSTYTTDMTVQPRPTHWPLVVHLRFPVRLPVTGDLFGIPLFVTRNILEQPQSSSSSKKHGPISSLEIRQDISNI